MIDKEILWEQFNEDKFSATLQLIKKGNLIGYGIHFVDENLKINIQYDDANFTQPLKTKFNLTKFYNDAPCLFCVRYNESFGFKMPYRNYGCISPDGKRAIVFTSAFGVVKSVVSGFASFIVEDLGYYPMHASVLATTNKGIAFSGGCMAGKTTALINAVDYLLKNDMGPNVLTDDWAIMRKEQDGYTAKTFDHSVSLKAQTIQENPHIKFYRHANIVEAINRQTKISMPPKKLYPTTSSVSRVKINTIVILNPEPGKKEPTEINADEFVQIMIDAAYHYPYINQQQIQEHLNFWIQVAKEIKILKFATRTENGKLQNFQSLWRTIL